MTTTTSVRLNTGTGWANASMGYKNVPLLSPNHIQLKQSVQSYKLLGFNLNLVDLAAFAGTSERTVHNHKNEILKYWAEKSLPSKGGNHFTRDRLIEMAITGTQSLEEMFGAILGTYLKIETDILDWASSLKEVFKIGQHLTRIYRLVCNYKNAEGVPVHSGNKSARHLLESEIQLDRLFVRSKGYVPGLRSKRWRATDLLKQFVEININNLLEVISKFDVWEGGYSSTHMFPKTAAKSALNNIYNNTSNIIRVKVATLIDFELNSIFSLLVRAVKIKKGEIFVPIIHESSRDESLGRSYNIFSRLRSKERLKLGYLSYDMNAALQSISLQLIKATYEEFPTLWAYTHDKEHKSRKRLEVAQALNIDVVTVKEKLTAFANGSVSGTKLHDYYELFQEESDRLRRAVLRHVSQTEPDVLERAIEQSKRGLPEELDWSDVESQETTKEMRDKASVFFFVWTWYERKIRQAMLTILTDGIELHDAVYSKMNIPVETVQDVIRERTGFDIIIEKEIP